ncbi:MAG: DoxX family protein [Rhodothermales bacterium]|nr:DoxX family protein [Rhodothermales bacterium]
MKYAPLAGRVLFSAVFIMFGLGHFTQTAMMAENLVPSWVPMPSLVVILTGVVIVAGGLMVLLGYRAKLGGLMLAAFLIPTAFLVHYSGFASGDQVSTGMFMKDMALAGAGLLIYHFGSGPMSLDDRAGG